MRLARTVRIGMGGAQLDEVHEAVVITGVDTGKPERTISTATRMGGWGQRITGEHWETLECTVSFAIDVPRRNLALRSQIFDAVRAWALGAEGTYISTNQKPRKRILVDRVEFPGSNDLFEWTDSYDIVFKAYSVPFWQDSSYTYLTKSTITKGSLTLNVPGEVTTIAGVVFKNKSGKTINNFSAKIGQNTMSFKNLGLPGNGELAIGHTSAGRVVIRMDGSSVLNKREGADDFYVEPGANTVTIDSDRAGSLEVSTIGRYR